MPVPREETGRRMKPGPFQQLLDEAARYGIDTTGYTNVASSAERLRNLIETKKAGGQRPQMVATKRSIEMASIPTFIHADAGLEQFTRVCGAYLMRLVDWHAGGSQIDDEPETPDELRDEPVRVLRDRIHIMSDEIHRMGRRRRPH